MKDADDSLEDSIPWPGFVDILSAVIMVFIFFVMLTIIIISQLSKKQKTPVHYVKTTATETLTQDNVHHVFEENARLKKEIAEMTYTLDRTKKSILQNLVISDKKDQIFVHFQDYGIDLTPENIKTLKQSFSKTDFLGKKIYIFSYQPQKMGTSAQQEIALNRAFNMRNYFLDYQVSPNKIKVKLIPVNSNDYKNKPCKHENDQFGCVDIQLK